MPVVVVQYDCVIGTSHVGQVCVPLCPNSEGSPACIPCEDVRSNCAWVSPLLITLPTDGAGFSCNERRVSSRVG